MVRGGRVYGLACACALAVALSGCARPPLVAPSLVGPVPSPLGEVTEGPVSADARIEYTLAQVDATSTVAAAAIEARVRVDSGANNAGPYEVVQAPVCAAVTTPEGGWRCTGRLPAGSMARLNVVGRHEVTVAAYLPPPDPPDPAAKQGESGPSMVWILTTADGPPPNPPPAAPVGTRVTHGCDGVPGEKPGETCVP